MNPIGQVPMLELRGLSSSYAGEPSMDVPRAMEGLQGISPPPFLTKTCDLVDDPNTNHIVSWSKGNNSFVVWDPEAFTIQLLPKYFKHSNLSSFIRQLNTYGFRKVDPDKLEFASEWFLRGQKHLLKNIKRRKPPSHPQNSHQGLDSSCVEVGQFEPETEIDRLRRDKQVLMVELVRLRQEQQNTKVHLKTIENRLKQAEMKQKHVMGFLARLIQNPSFIQQLNVQQDRRKKLEELISPKRRRVIDQGLSNVEVVELCQGKGEIDDKLEPENYGVIKVSRLKTPSVDMQALCGTSKESEERKDGGHNSLDKGFWEELLNDGIGEQTGLFGDEAKEENVDMFDEQLGFFGF